MKTFVFTIALILAMSALLCSYTSPSGFVIENDHNYYSDFNIYNNEVMNLDFVEGTLFHSLNVDVIVNVESEVNQVPVVISLSGFPAGDYEFNLSLDKQQIVSNTIMTWSYPIEFELTNLAWGIHELAIDVSDSTGVTVVNDVINFAVYERNTVWQNNNGDRVVLLQSGIPGANQEIRPVIFLEGFPIFDDSTYMADIINAWRSRLSTASSIYQLILRDGTRDVRLNAMVALAAIRFVHNHSPHQLKEGTSVFGYSMGGILARYALAYAEATNIEHYCSQYISLDAPHKGAALNENMQTMIARLEDWLDDNRFYINVHNALSDNDYDPDILDPYIRKLSSMAARQLFRANKWASGAHNYISGSSTFRELFSELDQDYGTLANVLNYDPNYPANQMKPGFPYKQNNIKCLAYSHGSLSTSGNTGNPPATIVSSYFIRFIIGAPWFWTSSDSYSAASLPYDTQPGSVFNDLRDFEQFPTPSNNLEWEFTQNYAPVIVPTRSSLGLRVNDITNPNTQIANLSMSSFANITENHSTLLNHTYFDSIVYPSSPDNSAWQWTHGDYSSSWVQTSMSSTVNWMNDIAQRTIGYIEGNLVDTDPSSVRIRMFVNGILNYNGFVEADGSYSIPYKYTKNTEVRLTFDKPNHLQTSKIVNVSYQNGHISYSPISDAVLQPYNLGNIIVSQSGQFSFSNVASVVPYLLECVTSGQYNGEAIVIKVMPGIYYESVDFSPLATGQISSLTLKGWGEGAVINAQNTNSCIRFTGNGINNINIENLTLTNGYSGILVNLANCMRLNVVNSTIIDCTSPAHHGLGIFSNVPTSVTNCTISGNNADESGQGDAPIGGGLYLVNHTESPTLVEDCSISNNHAGIASAIYIEGSGHFTIRSNRVFFNGPGENTQSTDQDFYIAGSVGSALIENNIFYDGNYANCIKIQASGSTLPQLVTIKNNTFDRFDTCISVNTGSRVSITNNVFEQSSKGICGDASDNIIQIKNNAFNTNIPFVGITYNPLVHTGCLFNEELDIDNNFAPIWNQTTMSPCIDAGTGVNDPDGTPADIGAFRATDHDYWQYRFRSGQNDRSDPYHWVSYPVVNSLTQGKTVARSFFHELLGTHMNSNDLEVATVLQEIVWYEENSVHKILWNGVNWGPYVDTHSVVSPQGYKVKLLSVDNSGLPPTTVELHHSGFLTPDNTPFMVYGSASNGVQTYENWIGYFDTDSVWPTDAFASIWNDITMIKAKDWCLYRDPNSGVGALIGKMLPINCGDMVIVTTVNDHEFQWNTTVPTDPKKKEVPTAFQYAEKADYTPVYIDLSAIDLSSLKEIGLKLDGICKGAVVVTDSLEQICAYLDDGESLSSGLVELVFFYESKSQPMEMRSVAINNTQLSSSVIGGDSAYPVHNIKVSNVDLSNTVVPVLRLEQNYPNPFNPTTSIRYSIDEPGAVSLDIYNIKGQLVKTLYHGNAEIGSHTAIWNGLDNFGNACSSGVYFYRLRTPKTSLVRKMLMLK